MDYATAFVTALIITLVVTVLILLLMRLPVTVLKLAAANLIFLAVAVVLGGFRYAVAGTPDFPRAAALYGPSTAVVFVLELVWWLRRPAPKARRQPARR